MSPRTSSQFQEIREEKMTLIMDVALKHFAGEGYFRTTISHIAGHAGISKGLLYNYFESKEELLIAIIRRSVIEIYQDIDLDRDGSLSEEEFVAFIRKISGLLREKKVFWRLLTQLLMQNDVRKIFLRAFSVPEDEMQTGKAPGDKFYPMNIMKMFTDYFSGKQARMPESYDPDIEFELFSATLKGVALNMIYTEEEDEEKNEKLMNGIIQLFK